MAQLLEEQRENWGSRAGFVLAAIGSAVGLGNLWGFPYKLYRYGGGAFLIPYIVAMLVIGIPVLILEFSLGHMTQRAAPDAFRSLGQRKEPVGWWGILLGFVIITYYPVILAWCLSFLWFSIEGVIWNGGDLPWAGRGPEGVAQTASFFLQDYANTWQAGEVAHAWKLGAVQGRIVLSLALMWLLMFVCIFRGLRIVSKVVFWTVPLPWLMLLILTVRGLTLDGATEGLAYYLNPDWSQLWVPTTWRYAFGQVFFSMSLAFGVMLTYASFLHRKSDINNNATVVGLGDLGTSFVAGIAVFATLGAMSAAAGLPIQQLIGSKPGEETGTVGLSFIAFPYALAQLPHSAWFAVVFFFALITLGIDSAFSITESILASLVDKTGWSRTALLWGITGVGFVLGLVYCTRGGITWLSEIDSFINGPWGIALLGLLECAVLGWSYRISRLRQHANERSDWRLGAWWDWNIRIVTPIVLSALFAWSLYDTLAKPKGYLVEAGTGDVILPNLVGLILAALAPALAVALSMVRSRLDSTAEPQDKRPHPSAPRAAERSAGAAIAVAAVVAAFVLLGAAVHLRLEAWRLDPETGLAAVPGVAVALVLALLLAGAALVATVLGTRHVLRAERAELRPHWTARLAGGLGAVAVGLACGVAMALWVQAAGITERPVQAQTELQLAAYVILALMLALIVGGLAWCFYRAIRAAGTDAPEQLPEDGAEAP